MCANFKFLFNNAFMKLNNQLLTAHEFLFP